MEPDCWGDGACIWPEDCVNNRDDDGDGDIDCAESDCEWVPLCWVTEYETCSDLIDNDGDGQIDRDAQHCAPHIVRDGSCLTYAMSCSAGFDDDGNGLADCDDPSCNFRWDCPH